MREARAAYTEHKNPRGLYEKEVGSGVWWIRYADGTGRIHREKIGSFNRAKNAYTMRKADILYNRKFPDTMRVVPVAFRQISADALAYSKTHKRSYGDDVIRMERILSWFRDWSAESITPDNIEQKLSESMTEQEWSPATYNRHLALLSLTYKLAIRKKKVKENPARLVKRLAENNEKIRFMTAEEETALRAVIVEHYAEHMPEFEVALNTGLRLSEMYNLRWQDVDVSNRVLAVIRSKNGEMRHAPMNSVVMTAFETLGKDRDSRSGYVFLNANDERLTGPRYWFEPAIKKAKIKDFTWHCLRHTFASRLTMKEVGLRSVQDLMGHKTVSQTVRYSHLAPKHQLDAVEKLVAGVVTQASEGSTANNSSTTTSTSE